MRNVVIGLSIYFVIAMVTTLLIIKYNDDTYEDYGNDDWNVLPGWGLLWPIFWGQYGINIIISLCRKPEGVVYRPFEQSQEEDQFIADDEELVSTLMVLRDELEEKEGTPTEYITALTQAITKLDAIDCHTEFTWKDYGANSICFVNGITHSVARIRYANGQLEDFTTGTKFSLGNNPLDEQKALAEKTLLQHWINFHSHFSNLLKIK